MSNSLVNAAIFDTDAIYGIGSGVDLCSALESAFLDFVDHSGYTETLEDIPIVTSICGQIEGFTSAEADSRLVSYVQDFGGCGFAFEFNPRTRLLDLTRCIEEEEEDAHATL